MITIRQLLPLFIFISSLHAGNYFIDVESAKTKEQLFSTSYQLDLEGYQCNIARNRSEYTLYVGPFSSLSRAKKVQHALVDHMQMRYSTIVERKHREKILYSSVKQASHKPKKTLHVKEKKDRKSEPNDNDFFIGTALGLLYANTKEKSLTGAIELDSAVSTTGVSVNLEGGYYFSKHIFMTLNYHYLLLDDSNFNNIFMSINYEFLKEKTVSPYVGILGGYSFLNWSEYPISSLQSDATSSSLMSGIVMGANVEIVNSLDLFIRYQVWIMNHTTTLENSQGKMQIEHDFGHNASLGVRFKF